MSLRLRVRSAAVLVAAIAAIGLVARLAAHSALEREEDGSTRIGAANVTELLALGGPYASNAADERWIRAQLASHARRVLETDAASADLESLLGARISGEDLPAPETAPLTRLRHRLAGASVVGRASVPLLDAAARADALARFHDARITTRSPDDFADGFDRALLIWLAALALASVFILASLHATSVSPGATLLALAAFAALTALGMTVLALSVGPLSGPPIAEKTALHLFFGVLAGIAALQALPLLARATKKLGADELFDDGRLALAAALILLAALALFGFGPAGSAARINLATPLGTFQPLELAKLLLVIAFAQHLGRHRHSLALLSRDRGAFGTASLALLAPFALVLAALLGSAWVLGDFGAGLVLAPTFALILVAASGSLSVAAVIAAAALASVPLAVLLPWPPDSKVFIRLATWLVPYANGLPGGDQLALAQQAVAAGGFTGTAWPSNPDAIPAGTNDLPLALLVERFGVLGLAVFTAAHVAFVYAGIAIGARLRGRRDELRYVPMALAFLISVQTAVAFAGLAGLFPLSGIVTPFLSEGGTGMLVFAVAAVAIARYGTVAAGRPRAEVDPLPRGLLVGFAASGAAVIAAFAVLTALAIGDPHRLTDPIPTQLADGRIAPRWGVLLHSVTGEIEPAPIVDARGVVLAEGARRYPFGAALAPVVGIARRGIAPLPGTLEAEAREHHARFPRRATAAELVEACAGECSARGAIWTPVGVVPRESAFKEMLVERLRAKHAGEELRFRPFTAPDFGALAGAVREGRAGVLAAMERIRAEAPVVQATLDAEVQAEVYPLLVEAMRTSKASRAAVVVRDAVSGHVLVRASGEAADPETVDAASYAEPALTGAFGTLRDHTTLSAVPPGSTFKPLTAIALLERGEAFQPDPCVHHARRSRKGMQGNLHIRQKDQSGWIADFGIDRPHGALDLEGAIEKSCNVWFAQAGLAAGAEKLGEVVSRVEVQAFRAEGGGVELAAAAIGQGRTLMTADQLSLAYAALANEGATQECELLFARDGSLACREVRLASKENAERIQGALRRVVMSPNGTGTRAREPKGADFTVLGKTGTAQQDLVRGETGPARDHAWFAGVFAGSNGRRFAFAILLARGGTGGVAAAPLAPKIGAVLAKHGYFEAVAAR